MASQPQRAGKLSTGRGGVVMITLPRVHVEKLVNAAISALGSVGGTMWADEKHDELREALDPIENWLHQEAPFALSKP